MDVNSFFSQLWQNFKKISQRFAAWFKQKWLRFQLWRWLTIAILSIFLLMSSYLVFVAKTTNVKDLKSELERSTEIYDEKGQKAGYLYSQKGTWKSLDQVSPNMVNAVLSTEDQNFYHEYGFSFKGIARAVLLYAKNKILGRNYISGGGSTLTQQLVKNALLSQEQTFSRKAKEIFIAMQVENEYSKKEIMTMYLNNAYFGNGVWGGVEDASEKYFGGVHANQLTVPQAATLAGMLTNPSGFNPLDHPKSATARRNVVLELMGANQKLTQTQVKQYQATAMVTNDRYQYASGYRYPYYFDAVISEAINKYGLSESDVMNRGYKIYTGLNQTYQEKMQNSFADSTLFPYNAADGTKAQGASIAVSPSTGNIMALVGGRSGTHVFRGYNRSTQLIRSPGSTIKPIAVYAPALEAGYHYDSTLKDELKSYGSNKYTPHNWNDVYAGNIMMYKALAQSKNAATVWLLNKIGVDAGYKMVKKFNLNISSSDRNLSLALGGLSQGESPAKMAGAYTAFANDGKMTSPHLIRKIVDASGKVIVDNTKTSSKRVLSQKNAREMTSMMLDVYQNGTGTAAKPAGYQIAGKTGSTQSADGQTTNDKDHWYIGYTPDVVVATWVGFDNTKYSLENEGTRGGSALFKDEMEGILPNTAQTSFKVKSASARVATSGKSSSSLWNGLKNAGDSVSKSASDLGKKAADLFDAGKQKVEQWFGN
nr:PBP1A family penicillin-binding protein [Liquorilactobacillus satsumensis]